MLLELIKIKNVSLHTLNVSSKAAMLKSLTSLPMRWLRHLVVLRPIITTPQLSENLSRFFTSSEDYFWGTAFASFIQVKDFSYSIGILIQLFEDWLWGFWRFKLNLIPWFDFFLHTSRLILLLCFENICLSTDSFEILCLKTLRKAGGTEHCFIFVERFYAIRVEILRA